MIKKCIALVGATGSGKSMLANEYARINGALVIRASDVIKKEMINHHIPISGRSMRTYAQTQMRKNGPRYWSEKIIASIPEERMIDELIVDGVRNIGGIDGLRSGVSKLVVVALLVNEDIRIQRVVARKRDIDQLPKKQLEALMRAEFTKSEPWGLELDACIERADIKIDASRPFEDVLQDFITSISGA